LYDNTRKGLEEDEYLRIMLKRALGWWKRVQDRWE